MNQKGFTLFEMLIVVVIMAMMFATVTIGFGRGEAQRFISEAQQLQAWMSNIQNQSVLTSTTWGARFEEGSAKAYVLSGAEWQAATEVEPYELAPGIELSHLLDDESEEGAGEQIEPQLVVLPTGQMIPPGNVTLSTVDSKISLDWSKGRVELERISDDN